MPTDPDTGAWYLESYAVDSRSLWRFPLHGFPVRVGRRPGIGLTLLSPMVSQDHAEISMNRGALHVRDLGSTNGTFVNGVRIPDGRAVRVQEGDILHFANAEFLLGRLTAEDGGAVLKTRTALNLEVPRQLVQHARRLDGLMRRRAVAPYLQPIVDLATGATAGYEVLGRGTARGLPQSPKELFELAASLGVAAELSRVFRAACAPVLRGAQGRPLYFLNMHPSELERPGLEESLRALRLELPGERLVLEIHEQAVTHPGRMRALRATLGELNIELAYDDFGAGRGRINELIEVPPDYLKFDETLIRGIDRAPQTKRELLQALVRMCRDGSVRTLAEGVETEAEAAALRALGFELAQGYRYGKPTRAKSARVAKAGRTSARRRATARGPARGRIRRR